MLGLCTAASTAKAADTDGPAIQRPRALTLSEPHTESPPQPEPLANEAPAAAGDASPATAEASERSRADEPPAPPKPSRGTVAESSAGDVAIKKESTPEPKKFAHRGFIFAGRLGTQACVRSLCGGSSHKASPGVRLDGFLGGNIRGFVDIGISGGWGTMGAKVEDGTNALSLYGVNPVQLQQMAVLLGQPLDFNVFALGVTDTKLRMARVGPHLRIHFIPRGRAIAYVGSGFGYSKFSAIYKTNGGDTRVDLHGLDVPIEIGGGMQVHKNIAVTAQFDYYWTKYAIATLTHPDQKLTLPVRVLDDAAAMTGGNVSNGLPQFWSLTLGARFRI